MALSRIRRSVGESSFWPHGRVYLRKPSPSAWSDQRRGAERTLGASKQTKIPLVANLQWLIALVSTLALTACSGSRWVTIHTPNRDRAEALEKISSLYQRADLHPCILPGGPLPGLQSVWCDNPLTIQLQNYFPENSPTDEIVIYIHVRQWPDGRENATALARAIETYVRQELPEGNVRVRQIRSRPRLAGK